MPCRSKDLLRKSTLQFCIFSNNRSESQHAGDNEKEDNFAEGADDQVGRVPKFFQRHLGIHGRRSSRRRSFRHVHPDRAIRRTEGEDREHYYRSEVTLQLQRRKIPH